VLLPRKQRSTYPGAREFSCEPSTAKTHRPGLGSNSLWMFLSMLSH